MLSRSENKTSADGVPQENYVAKAQFDELNRKYNELLAQMKASHDKVEASKNEVVAKIPQVNKETEGTFPAPLKPETAEATTIDPSELLSNIDQALSEGSKPELNQVTEAKSGMQTSPIMPSILDIKEVNLTDDIDEQIKRMQEAFEFTQANKFENALTIIKELETSKDKQIAVRAKMMLGELLFNNNEYDLAMQVYEEVIKKHGHSGFVLKALGRLVSCSEKLKLAEKQAKYYSLLHDFFEAA